MNAINPDWFTGFDADGKPDAFPLGNFKGGETGRLYRVKDGDIPIDERKNSIFFNYNLTFHDDRETIKGLLLARGLVFRWDLNGGWFTVTADVAQVQQNGRKVTGFIDEKHELILKED